jgi:hypothetical protein
VERSVFDGGLCAVSVVASDEFAFEDIVYAHNTIHRCQSWILWRNADEQPQPMSAVHEITFRNNLLLDVHDTAAPSTANAAGWFSNNVWRADSQTNAEHAGRVAQVVTQLPLKSEERDDPDYLTPDVERLRNVVGDDAPLPGHFVPQQP